jgi:hypothetical protein
MTKHAKSLIALIASAFAFGVGALPATADQQFDKVEVSLSDSTGDAFQSGEALRTAGGHPDMRATFAFKTGLLIPDLTGPVDGPLEDVRQLDFALPVGMTGNPTVVPRCSNADLVAPGLPNANCSPDTQVGTVFVTAVNGDTYSSYLIGLFNIEPAAGEPARFGFNFNNVVNTIVAHVRPGDYGISSGSLRVSTAEPLKLVRVNLWGVPADPVHDPERLSPATGAGASSSQPLLPFLTAPGSCTDEPATFVASADSWQNPGRMAVAEVTADPDGIPFKFDGCEQLPFAPTVTARPLSHVADAPTGLDVDVDVPQTDTATGRTTAHVRKVVLALPEGMSVSPGSAAGLGACAPAQIGLGTNDAPSCPDSSKIGTVTVDTPLLSDPLEGDVILAKQNDNPFGSLLALYMVVKGPGFYLKLPGRVDPDPVTGRLTTTFDNTPQLPFSHLKVRLRGGSRASLATPAACGTYSAHVEVTSWATDKVVSSDTPMTIDEGCSTGGFAPGFSAGSVVPIAGQFSPFTVQIDRPDGQQILDGVTVEMPEGALAKLKGVPLCPDAEAIAGTCDAGSRVGSATVGAGPGSAPFVLADQPVYLAGPYKGAPYSLSVATRVIAGPLDLGTIVVRQALHVDPDDAHVTVVSDPLPTIIEGIPLRLRSVDVDIDRPGFTMTPTSCEEKEVVATLHSAQGATVRRSSRFQVGGCAGLGFTPKLGLRLTGKSQMRSGGHPSLRALLTQRSGQANIAKAKVTLPKNVVLDSKNAYDPKLVCDYDKSLKADCPASSKIGKATLNTPILDKPLTGAVHLVQGIRFGPTGNRIRTLPTLLVKLRGEVSINLRSKTSVDRQSRLVSTFPNVPDAPAAKFSLQINGGKKGILTVTENRRGRINLCKSKQTALVNTDGQNGRNADYPTRVATPCKTGKKKR